MSEEILPIPPLPEGLREAAQRGTLIPFVGAGASRLAGCLGWQDFADGALRQLVDHGKISHGHLAQINHLNPRVKLSLARILQKEHGLQIDFRKLLQPPDWRNNQKGRQLYGSLSRLGKRFVTTNYDEWLDDELVVPTMSVGADVVPAAAPAVNKRTPFYRIQDLTAANLSQPDSVIHLHGSLLEPEGMILTTQDYVKHYANDRSSGEAEKENRVLTFLEYLFKEKTVLFVGYGLEELEILEYVILKARHIADANHPETRHYLLHGFFSHEKELMRSMKRYYLEECGIQLIPFLRDQKDWDQLLDVLDEFARLAPASEPMYLQEFKEMESLLDG